MVASVVENVIVTAACIVAMAVAYIVLSKYKGVKVDNLSIDDIDQIEETEK
jgi:hypothetical protein